MGEGSEFGRQWREEARRRKRGYAIRKKEPDDQPWVLREKKKGGKQLSGQYNYKGCLSVEHIYSTSQCMVWGFHCDLVWRRAVV